MQSSAPMHGALAAVGDVSAARERAAESRVQSSASIHGALAAVADVSAGRRHMAELHTPAHALSLPQASTGAVAALEASEHYCAPFPTVRADAETHCQTAHLGAQTLLPHAQLRELAAGADPMTTAGLAHVSYVQGPSSALSASATRAVESFDSAAAGGTSAVGARVDREVTRRPGAVGGSLCGPAPVAEMQSAPLRSIAERSGVATGLWEANAPTGELCLSFPTVPLLGERAWQGGSSEVAAHTAPASFFVRDLRGLQDTYRSGYTHVGGDVQEDPFHRFDVGERVWRPELVITPILERSDMGRFGRASVGRMLTPQRRELRVARSPKPVAGTRCGLMRALTAEVESRCEEVVE